MKTKVCKGKSVRLTHRLAVLALFLLCFLGAKGQQTDYSGVYYFANYQSYNVNNSSTNWYMVPADDPHQSHYADAWFNNQYCNDPNGKLDYTGDNYGDSEQPFITTYQTDKDNADVPTGVTVRIDNSIWIVTSSGETGYYHIIHASTGKYVVYEPPYKKATNRKSMHLLTTTSPGENAKFAISDSGSGINVRPKSITEGNCFFNPAGNNQARYYGTGNDYFHSGMVGLYSDNGANSIWLREPALCEAPEIQVDELAGSYIIKWHDLTWNHLPSNYFIRYTEDGSDPYEDPNNTAMDYTSNNPIVVEHDGTIVKAVVVRRVGENDIMKLSNIDTKEVNTGTIIPDTPTFSVTCENELVITCNNMPLAQIYYTYTDGTTEPDYPSNNLTNPNNHYYEGAISGFLDGYKVKAIAYNGSHVSDVSEVYTFYNNTPAPSVTLSENAATVTFGSDETIYYTTNGDHPYPDGYTATTSPHDINGLSYDVDVDIRVVATSPGRGNSCPVTVVKRPKQPTINTSNACVETNKVHSLTFDGTEPGKTYWYALSNGSDQPAPDPDIFTYTEYTPGSTVDIAAIPAWNGTDIWVTLHAYAMTADGFRSHLVSENYMLKYTDAPSITYVTGASEATVIINAVSGATIQYSVDGGSSWQTYSEPFGVLNNYTYTVIAKAKLGNEGESCEVTKIVRLPKLISSLTEIDDANGAYDLTANIDDASSFTGFSSTFGDFTGSLNGNNHTISKLKVPLFNVINGGTVNNLFFDNVEITTGNSNGNVGAVCSEATGASRIYNCGVLATNSTVTTDEDGYTIITDCSSTISGTSYVGGIVGLLAGSSRVINCFSYANITGGNVVGGIVGRNDVATTSSNLKTMVMNCMFYGDITGGNSKAPIYNGTRIANKDASGVSNFNYFWSGASYVQNKNIQVYHCALAAETRFLQRFEFFRHLLNSHREVAAWWVTGDSGDKDVMLKWVMEPSQIGTSTPYPILKTPGKYPSVVNYDAEHAVTGKPRNQGGKLGELSVSIRMGNGEVYTAPSGASIGTTSLTLNILDKDTTHFNYNYYKVQLPYYNDVGSHNYNGNRVVTGWKIVSVTKNNTPITSSTGCYSTGTDVTFDGENINIVNTPYNFADRDCVDKDLYVVSKRVFNQGAYWDVPEGVTAITIEPYWAKCAYLADPNADKVYNKDMTTGYDVPNVGGGQIYINGNSYSIAGDDQVVFTSMGNAIASSGSALFSGVDATNHTVYDYAVVLVGNYHNYNSMEASNSKPYTVTSIDLDGDNEPDYSYILRFDSRKKVHPVRVDFINIPGLGMAQKSYDGTGTYNFGIMQPNGWFESTNTSLFRETQFEYDNSNRIASPYILQGGVMEQWVLGQSAGHSDRTTYFHVGGNVWFKEFHRGSHQDMDYNTNHTPVSVTGGDFDQFYLTGLYTGNVTSYNDNAECYVNGGRFGTVAGAGMEGIGHPDNHTNGNITWLIDHADINEFYAGGINAAKPVEGNLRTIISNSHVNFFCGGPKFGDMNAGRTVITTATDCTFGIYFGAGYGGNSYNRYPPYNFNNVINIDWNEWVNGNIQASDGDHPEDPNYHGFQHEYSGTYDGVDTQIDYQFIPMSGNTKNCARLWIEYVKFSLATTHSITSTLTGCTIDSSFYGGGSLGRVEGSVVSVLDGCTVKGNVFGAGYSATMPKVSVMNTGGFAKQPSYDDNLGVYLPGEFPASVEYTWDYKATVNSTETAIDPDSHKLFTTIHVDDKTNLGKVTENVFLIIKGHSTVFKNVFGGGAESQVGGNTEVKILGATKVLGNIYGGGDMGEVEGNTKVIVNGDNDSGSGGGGN